MHCLPVSYLPKGAEVHQRLRLRLVGAGGTDLGHQGTSSTVLIVDSHRTRDHVVPDDLRLPTTKGRDLRLNIDFEICGVREGILSSELLTREGWNVITRKNDGYLQRGRTYIPLLKRRGGWFLATPAFLPCESSRRDDKRYVSFLRTHKHGHSVVAALDDATMSSSSSSADNHSH